jgi:pyridoxamine 5'-phosphate oxidase
MRQFERWFADAREAGAFEPEAMTLATATGAGEPSARMVLLKGVDERGFRFFTSYASRKGRELDQNPRAALLFHWQVVGRQVRVEGSVERLSARETETYVRSRSRASQLSALASRQSEVIPDREELEARVAALDERHVGEELPLPQDWGGYLLAPSSFELWQHRDHRLHDRFRYRAAAGGWEIERLSP